MDWKLALVKNYKKMDLTENELAMIDEISNAIFDLAKSKTGAIIFFERNTKLFNLIYTALESLTDTGPGIYSLKKFPN